MINLKWCFLLISCVGIFSCEFSRHAFENVQLPKSTGSTYTKSQVEPSIAINPNNTQEMIAGTVMDDYYYSLDGGKSWKASTMKSEYGVNGDPVMYIDSEGRYYYVHLANPVNGNYLDRIVCQYTDDIRGDWTSSATKPNGTKVQDKPWITECPKTGRLILTWTQFDAYKSDLPGDSSVIMFAKSTDRGETWSDPKRISRLAGDCMDGNNTVEGAVPAVGLDGTIYVAWTGPHGLRLNRSTDGGDTWLEKEIKIGDHPGGWSFNIPGIYRANGLPILKIDNSPSPYQGRLYLNWSDQRNGVDDTDVFVCFSDDQGNTWSDAQRVNQDKSKRQQFFTWMDIDQSSGDVYFVYYDRRNHPDWRTDVYLAHSSDGMISIKENLISENSFIPNPELFFGDYTNISVVDGVIRPIWTKMHEDKITLWTALINRSMLE